MKNIFFAVFTFCMFFGWPAKSSAISNDAFDRETLSGLAKSGSLEELEKYITRHKAAISPHHLTGALLNALSVAQEWDKHATFVSGANAMKRSGHIRLLLRSGANSSMGVPLRDYMISPEILKIFLEEGAEVRPEGKPSPLHAVRPFCVSDSPCYVLENTALLLEAGADPNAPPFDSEPYSVHKLDTPLTHVISPHSSYRDDFSLPLAKMLLQAGANPNYGPSPDETPLNIAVTFQRKDILMLLLEAGADPSLGNPLAQALSVGEKDLAEVLLRQGASLKGDAGGECLRAAARGSTPDMVKKLLDAGVETRLRDKDGYTALDYALSRTGLLGGLTAEGEKISAMLRQAGAPALTEQRRKLYETASNGGLEAFTAILLDNDTYPNQEVLDNALHRALQAGHERDRRQIVALLLEKGANKGLQRPLQENVPPEILQLFLQAGAELHPKEGSPPLFMIPWEKSNATALARVLLDAGADPNAPRPAPLPPLPLALARGTPLAALALPLAGAAMDAEKREATRAPLSFAAEQGGADALDLLADRGAAIGARNSAGLDALAYALNAGKAENAAVLLARGAVPDGGHLEMAVRSCPGSLRALLNKGADVKSDAGFRALCLAVKEGAPETVALFIGAGADIRRRTVDGKNLIELAQDRKRYLFLSSSEGEAIVELLRNAGL